MFPSSTLLSFLVLALSTTIVTNATPIQQPDQNFVLDFVAKLNANGSKNLADADRAHAASLIARAQSGNTGTNQKRLNGNLAVNDTGVTYTASVGIGSPPTKCKPTCSPSDFRNFWHFRQIRSSSTPVARTLGSGPTNHTSRPALRKILVTPSQFPMAVGAFLEKNIRILYR